MDEKKETVEDTKVEGTGEVDTQATEKNEGKSYTAEEAQKMADAMVAKKLKGMPTKEELKAYNDWKEAQKTEAEKTAEKEKLQSQREIELVEAKKELAVFKAGVNSEQADYVVFKVSKMDGDFEENLQKFLKDNPKYLSASEESEKQFSTGVKVEKKVEEVGGVSAILKAKYPNLYK